MKTAMTVIITIGVFLLGVIAVLALSRPANATDRSGPTNPTPTTYSAPDNDTETWKYVVGGAILTCAVLSVWKQRWCWEDAKPEPLPDPGAAVKNNDVTPDVQKRTYVIEAN
jgi:hypothetical protein